MRCLVTGVAGFIGSHLAERLIQEGYEVIGIDCFLDYYPQEIKRQNLTTLLASPRFRFVEDNLLTADLSRLLDGVEVVFHQAAQAGVRASWGTQFAIYTENNILATQRLLEACVQHPLHKFVYASTSSVYGDTPQLPMQEESILKPVSPYGVSKLAGEHLCYLYWKHDGIPTISLRYFTVFGPRQRPDMAFHRFIRALQRDEEIVIYGDGHQTRDFTYVSDVVEANLLAMRSPLSGEVFNIGGGSRVSLLEALHVLENIMAKPLRLRYDSVQKGDMRHTYADISRAQKQLGYSPRISLAEGLREEVRWLEGGG
ncbi:MAG: NAD-dependent epimerase/dehydratase family protein [Nitrospinota bacterium]|nr:MAG: NAD-dependent epimerase/dehydratase family protein [Nitrospinota bacterium]